jgi:hypothetical protein
VLQHNEGVAYPELLAVCLQVLTQCAAATELFREDAPATGWSELRNFFVKSFKGMGPFHGDKLVIGLVLAKWVPVVQEGEPVDILGPGCCTGIIVRESPLLACPHHHVHISMFTSA